MDAIGRTLARLAARTGGQLMLELPDDLPPNFVAALIRGANAEIDASPSFALFAHDRRQDVGSIDPRVDFRELVRRLELLEHVGRAKPLSLRWIVERQ